MFNREKTRTTRMPPGFPDNGAVIPRNVSLRAERLTSRLPGGQGVAL